jgi:proliferating cell nuclear antigen
MHIIISNHAKAESFAMMFQHMKAFSDHINIMFESSRFYIQCMDSAHVSIMELTLPSTWFDVYSFTEPMTIGLSSAMLYKILNSRGKMQELKIEVDSDSSDNLSIHFTGDSKNEFDKHFELPLMSIDSELMEIPGLDYQAELTLTSSHYASIIGQLQMFGDTMTIDCSENRIMLVSQSRDQGKMFVEIKIDDVAGFSIEEGLELKLSFALGYIRNMCLYNKITDQIEIKLSENFPMKVVYTLGQEDATMCFYLAPKMNDDND